jgi:hypothetical protein
MALSIRVSCLHYIAVVSLGAEVCLLIAGLLVVQVMTG